MNALTRVQIKRYKRTHPDATDQQVLDHTKSLTDMAGVYPDTVTLEDVRDAVASMRENQERQEAMW